MGTNPRTTGVWGLKHRVMESNIPVPQSQASTGFNHHLNQAELSEHHLIDKLLFRNVKFDHKLLTNEGGREEEREL